LYGIDQVINTELQFLSKTKNRIDTCMNYTRPQLVIILGPIKKAFFNAKNRNVKIRYLTEITTENISYCKEMISIVDELRHLDGIKGNFMLSESEYLAPVILFEKGKIAPQIIYSNIKELVEQQQYVFDSFWNKAIPIADKIKEIEQGIKLDIVETIKDPLEIQTQYINLVRSATNEIMLIIPTTNALMRHADIGIFQLLRESTANNEKVSIRILTPFAESVEPDSKNRFSFHSSLFRPNQLQVRNIEQSSGHVPQFNLLIIDTRECLITEIKDDLKQTFSDAIGIATYSNSKATVLSYISIFESFWLQTEMYKKVKETEQMQKEFINIAAHELRNPIQPILSLTDIVKNKVTDTEQKELLGIVVRNAKKLKQLTEDVLDVTRIESNSLQLNKEGFSLNDLVMHILQDYKNQITDDNKIKLVYDRENHIKDNDIIIQADKYRINQVISNLVSNSFKFTKEGGTISIKIKSDNVGYNNNGVIIVSVKDTGTGIDPEILPRLFTKFTTKSETAGTGLGLFISKSIIEAHGGRIWAVNNSDGKGATFYFSLPLLSTWKHYDGKSENKR
jgi:two-component system, OmpR family, sensor histidine kinase VicK